MLAVESSTLDTSCRVACASRASDPDGASVEVHLVELKDIFENQPPTDLNGAT